MPFFDRVEHESVYFLTKRRAYRIPAPPTMRNHGNYVASLSQLGRWLAEEAEALGVTVLPETSAEKLLVSHGRVAGVRTGDRGRGRDGEPLARFEPGSDIAAHVTVLAEGTQGYLTGAAIEHFGLRGRNPQVWALGVKEVWRVPKPLRKVIHTMGWPLRARVSATASSAARSSTRWATTWSRSAWSSGSTTATCRCRCTICLQELKTHKRVRKILDGGERIAWGAKTIPEGGFYSLPSKLHAPGLVFCGDGAGFVNVPALKGIHYAVESGVLAAEAIAQALRPGEAIGRAGALAGYDEAMRESFVYEGSEGRAQHASGVRQGLLDGRRAGGDDDDDRRRTPRKALPTELDSEQELLRTDRAASFPAPDGKLTFDKLSSVFLSGNQTRDDAPSHIRVARRVPREVAELWVNMCPAHVYELGREDAGKVDVVLTPSNCVQCGAITAKGGRLLPAEGGAGPEYSLT